MEGKDAEMHVTQVAERHSTHASLSDEDENVVPEGSRLLASSSKSDGHGAHEVSGEVREDNGKDSHGGSKSEPVIFGYKLKGAFFVNSSSEEYSVQNQDISVGCSRATLSLRGNLRHYVKLKWLLDRHHEGFC